MAQLEKGVATRSLILLVAVLTIGACKSEATKQAELQALVAQKEAEDQILAGKKLADEQAATAKKQADELALVQKTEERIKAEKAQEEALLKAKILATPDAFLQVTNAQMVNNGLLDSQRQLVRMSVTNKTAYPLTGLSGEVQWVSDRNEVAEVTLFKLRGSLVPGDTKTFATGDGSMDSGTTVSHAHKLKVAFKQVRFLEVAE